MAQSRAAGAAGPASRPYVVVHVAVSLDGATTGFDPDVARFYELARTWREDVTLTGADTILAQEPALAVQPGPGPSDDGPLLAVVDSRRRVRAWQSLRDAGHWSAVIALRSRVGGADGAAAHAGSAHAGSAHAGSANTGSAEDSSAHARPANAGPAVEELVLGEDRVDLGAALEALAERGAQVVRVDSGGSLTGALLRAGLVDEISLLVHPCLAGAPGGAGAASGGQRWYGSGSTSARTLRLVGTETFDDAVVWLRYRR
jgi:2,5-diamino-6-(ribosylamino)-4(3H)-pyrimidinone 5'-phosphate reductase